MYKNKIQLFAQLGYLIRNYEKCYQLFNKPDKSGLKFPKSLQLLSIWLVSKLGLISTQQERFTTKLNMYIDLHLHAASSTGIYKQKKKTI